MKEATCKYCQRILLFIFSFLPYVSAHAISAACANFSVSSFPDVGWVSIGSTSYAAGPFLPGDYVTVGVNWTIPAIAGYVPDDSFSLVDAKGNVLAGPFRDAYSPLTYRVQTALSSIGVKNLGGDPANINDFTKCEAAPIAPASAPAADTFSLGALLILLIAFVKAVGLRRAE